MLPHMLCLVLLSLLLTACSHPGPPTVEEGWIPLAEWQRRTQPRGPSYADAFMESLKTPTEARPILRTFCWYGKHYSSCRTY